MDKPMDVLSAFPVRKSSRQKQAFRAAVRAYGENLGYTVREEKGSFGARNVIMGDPDKAHYLITAHYDTCAWMIIPNFITPCNLPVYILYQLLLVVGLILIAGLCGGLIGVLLKQDMLGVLAAELLYFGILLLMMAGPANRHNANDNTSGVISVLETAAALPENLRGKVCFVLFDLEEAGLIGSSSYRKAHKKAVKNQIILNLDCVGDGDEIVLFPTKGMKKDSGSMELLRRCCPPEGEKRLYMLNGFGFYPSDQAQFPKGVGIAALRRSRLIGLYMSRIHTHRDTVLEEKNVKMLRDYLLRVVAAKPE